MSDYDRGGYQNQPEPPLAFDPRGQRGPRRAPPTTLIISAVVLGVMVAGVAAYYRSGIRHPGQAPEVVGQPVGELRGPAPASAQPADDGSGLQVYKSEGPQAAAASAAPASDSAFASEPEAPAARPAPRPAAPIAALPPAPVEAAHVAPVKPAKPAAVEIASAAPPKSAKPAPSSSSAPAALTVASAAPPKPAAGAPAKGAAVVQIGAFSSAALADKGWNDLARRFPGDMAGRGKSVSTVDKDGTTFFRTFVTGFSNKAEAQAFCGELKAAGKSCIVK